MIHRKAMSLMSTAEAIAATAAAALSQATSQQTSPTGSTVTHNADGTRTITGSVLGTDPTGTSVTTATHVGDTTPPGVPTGVTAWSGDGSVHVSWDGTLEGGIPADFCQVNLLVDGVAFASLNSAGSATYNKASAGTTVKVTATAEDDACAIDGTAAHNVSSACSAISVTVNDTAAATAQHFWADTDGAHISSTGDHDTSGLHQLMTSVKNAFMHGNTELMTISEDLIELGKNSVSSAIKMCGGSLVIQTREVSGSPYVDGLTWIGNVSDRSSVTMRGGAAVGLTIGGSEDERSDVWMGLQHAEAGVLDSPPVSIVTGVQRHSVSAATVGVHADSVEVSNQAMTSSVTVPMSRLATLLSDTGWTWIADYGSGDGIRWRCVAGVVYVQAAIYGEHTVGTGAWDAGTIPASYRPSSDVAVPGTSFGALTNPTQLRVGSNGKVNLWAPSSTTYFGGSLSYPLEA